MRRLPALCSAPATAARRFRRAGSFLCSPAGPWPRPARCGHGRWSAGPTACSMWPRRSSTSRNRGQTPVFPSVSGERLLRPLQNHGEARRKQILRFVEADPAEFVVLRAAEGGGDRQLDLMLLGLGEVVAGDLVGGVGQRFLEFVAEGIV